MQQHTQSLDGHPGATSDVHRRDGGAPLRAAIIAADGVEQVEVTAPRDALQRAGADVKLLSPDGASVLAYHYIDPKRTLRVQGALRDVDPSEIDVLVVPGGLGSPDTLRSDEDAIAFVRSHAEAGKPLGVICHGPWVLIEAGVIAGRTLTCVPQVRSDVTNAGATYVDEEVHVDRTGTPWIVSGRNFEAAEPFAQALVEAARQAVGV